MPNYMHHSKLLEYFKLFAKEFSLYTHIHFQTKVMQVDKSKEFPKNGRWELTIKSSEGYEMKETFDAVMLCTGHHAYRKLPTLNGANAFKGRLMHSHEYRHGKGFEDKTVVLIGIGNSGVDVAVDLSTAAKEVMEEHDKNHGYRAPIQWKDVMLPV